MSCRLEIPLLLLAALALPAQTLVEYSLSTAAGSAGAASSMQKAGKAVAAALEKSAKTLDAAGKSATSVVAVPKSGTAPAAVKLSPPPDPAAIRIGIEGREVIAKFGQPAMKLSSSEDETWFYGNGPGAVTLTLRDGKVSTVSGPARPKETQPQEITVLQ